MKHNFVIDKIELACIVKAGTGKLIHNNRPSHGLAIFLDGKRTFHFDNKKLEVTKNTLVYFPKGSNYTIKEKISSDCYAINFQMPDGAVFEPFAFKIKNLGNCLESFKQSQKVFANKKIGYSSKVKSELYNIIYNMQTEYAIPYGTSQVIQPAIDYIHSNFHSENIQVSYLAKLCGISTEHLRTTFIKNFALSPIKYINNLKLTYAEELLSSQLYTIKEVCFMSGYNDESHFCREFKKRYKTTPYKYKQASRN